MSSLEIDVPALRTAAGALRTVADSIPRDQVIDLVNSGSAQAAAAAEAFNMWSMVTGALISGRISKLADDADLAATAFETAEAELAAQAGTP